LLGRRLCLLSINRLDLWSLLLAFAVSSASTSLSCSSSSRSSLLLLLLEGGLIWTTLNSADLFGLLLVARRASVVALFPGKYDGVAELVEVELFDTRNLADDLGKAVHLPREFGHEDHCLDVPFDDNTRFCHPTEIGGELVDGEGRVGVDGNPHRESCLELKVSGPTV
jgi:hypothetical protein